MSKLRIAMVGAGTGRGQSWMQSLKKLSEPEDLYDFCALCEVNAEKREQSAERWGVAGYANLLEMLDEAGPDAILNGTPPDCNVMAVPLAARRGVHVMTEIPIAPTLAMADSMIETTRANGVKYEVAEQVYLWAEEQLKRKIIDEGLIGEPQHARLYYTNKADYHGINGARMLIRSEATRVLGVTGEVRVPAFTHFTGNELSESRWDHAVIEFESGVVCLFESPPRGRMSRRWDIEGSEGQLFGEELYIGSQSEFESFPFITEYTQVEGDKVLEHVRVDTDPPVVFDNPFKDYRADSADEVARMQLLVGFHEAITQDAEPEYGAPNARKDIEILLAMRESARLGSRWVDLPLTEETELERRLEEEFRAMYGHDASEVEALVDVPFPQGGVRYTIAGWD